MPKYPKFTPVHITHKEYVNKFTSRFEPYSDFNFTSLFSWSDELAEISILNRNLVIKMPDYTSTSIVYSLLGTHQVGSSIEKLLDSTSYLSLVPEVTALEIMNDERFSIVEDRDNYDYIYKVTNLVKMEGKELKKIRQKVKSFTTFHMGKKLRTHTIDGISKKLAQEIIRIDHEWAIKSSREEGDLLSERRALAKLLENSGSLNLVFTGVFVDESLKAFSINEVLTKNYAICHFEKSLKDHHVNINAFLVHAAAKALEERDIKFVNWEQDLGLSGLRHSKQSYKPVKMLVKYKVSRAKD